MKSFTKLCFYFILALIMSFFAAQLTHPHFKEFDTKERNVAGHRTITLPQNGFYLLKIWGDSEPKSIYFNSRPIIHFYFKEKKEIKEFYYILRNDITKKGANDLFIFSDSSYSVRIKNHYAYSDFTAVMLKSDTGVKKYNQFVFFFLCFFFLSVLFWEVLKFIFNYFFGIFLDKFITVYFLSFLPIMAFYFFVTLISWFMPLRPVFFGIYFIPITFFLALSLFLSYITFFILRSTNHKPVILKENIKIKVYAGRKLIQWWTHNVFCDKCIIIFFAILSFSILLLILKIKPFAQFLSIICYCLLSLVAVIRYVCVLRDND